MQHTEHRSPSQLTATCFDLEAYESMATGEAIAPALLISPPPFLRSPIPPTSSLSMQPTRQRLDNWRLLHNHADAIKLAHIIGAVVQTAKGRTSPITSFDPATRRVRTHSGSVYELGTPEMAFERIAPEVVRCLGF